MKAPEISPVRWWRDEETRYLSRPEYRAHQERRHFNLSEIPRGDNPELDAYVENWRDTHGFVPPGFELKTEFVYHRHLDEPDPLRDVMRYWSTYINPATGEKPGV